MKIGTTSFGFRYALLDAALAPPLAAILERARAAGLAVLQICENARPMTLDDAQWDALVRTGEELGVEVQLGAKTLDPAAIAAHIARAARTPSRMLRVVLEKEGGPPPPPAQLASLLAAVWPCLRESGVRLAIENHFDIPSSRLAAAVQPYPPEHIGFCVDTANSLRNFESPEAVMDLLGPRAFCYHIKDFAVDGNLLGFTVSGAPLGAGRLDLDGILDRILARHPEPRLFVENWVPPTGDRESDIAEDARWLAQGADELLRRLRARGRAV